MRRRPLLPTPRSRYSRALPTAFEPASNERRGRAAPLANRCTKRARLSHRRRAAVSVKTWRHLVGSKLHRRRESHKATDGKAFFILRAEGIVTTFSRQIPRPSGIASHRKTIANFSITDDGIVGRLQPLSWNTLVLATLERDGHVF